MAAPATFDPRDPEKWERTFFVSSFPVSFHSNSYSFLFLPKITEITSRANLTFAFVSVGGCEAKLKLKFTPTSEMWISPFGHFSVSWLQSQRTKDEHVDDADAWCRWVREGSKVYSDFKSVSEWEEKIDLHIKVSEEEEREKISCVVTGCPKFGPPKRVARSGKNMKWGTN